MRSLSDALTDLVVKHMEKIPDPDRRQELWAAYQRGREQTRNERANARAGQLGIPRGKWDGDPDCERCYGAGYVKYNVRPDHADFGKLFRCECWRSRYIPQLWQRSGLEPDEQKWTPEYLTGWRGKDALRLWLNTKLGASPSGFATLFGEYGVGKSGALKSLVAGFIRQGIPARYVHAGRFLSEVRSSFSKDSGETETRIVDRYAGVRVLCLDEFDRIPKTDFAHSELLLLLEARYNKRSDHLTTLATNADPDDMPDHWAYVASRMRAGERIEVKGEDMRTVRLKLAERAGQGERG